MHTTSTEQHIQRTLIFIALLVFIFSLYLDSFLTPEPLATEPTIPWEGPWNLYENESLLASNIQLPYKIEGPVVGRVFTLRYILPSSLPPYVTTLAIDTSMTSLQAEIEGQVIYEFKAPDRGWKRPVYGGTFTHFIRLDDHYLGKELSLVYEYSSNNAFAGSLQPIIIGSKASLIIAKSTEWPSLFFGFALLLLGFLTVLFSMAIQTTEERMSFFYFGGVLLLLGFWVFSQTPCKFLLFRNPALPMNFSFLALYLLPLILTNYIIHSYEVGRAITYFQRSSLAFIIVYIAGGLLQVAGVVQYTDLLLVSGLALALFLLALFSYIIYEFIKGKRNLSSFIIALSCLTTSIFTEVILLAMHISLDSAVILHAGMTLAAAILFMHSVYLVRQKTQSLCKEEMLLSLAYIDVLTGVGSRAAYERELERISNSRDKDPLGILVMDINNLKQINDTLGHDKGDMILKDFAQRLKKLLPHHTKIFRFGGDEFIALVPHVTEDEIHLLAEKVLTFFQTSKKTEYQVAVGYDRYIPKKKEKIVRVVRRADAKMYQTKSTMKKAQEISILT